MAVVAAALAGPGLLVPGPAAAQTCLGLRAVITGSGAITGTSGGDVIAGSSGVDTIDGNGGNDSLNG